jgi:hypothetical protein
MRSAPTKVAVLLPWLLSGAAAGADTHPLFADEFELAGPIDERLWTTPIFAEQCNPAYIPRTAFRNWLQAFGQDELLVHEDGYAILPLDTYNPFAGVPGDSFYGTEIDSTTAFEIGTGLSIEARVWLDPALPRGVVASLFAYRLVGACPSFLTDEVDFELLSNLYLEPPVQVLTNIYAQDPPGPGHPLKVDTPGAAFAGEWNTLRVELYPNRIEWFLNGVVIARRCEVLPTLPVETRLNIWVPDEGFACAYDADFQPVADPDDNTRYEYRVDYVRVFAISTEGCPADIECDGEVGVGDLIAVIANWGESCHAADLDGDLVVGVGDLIEVIAQWGPCGP